ncbi:MULTISPECIES: hypothetical protein [unclassified Allomuricauda]|uniref:hypothetical protein n=1 Tax=unclassified Allomuricauda TaxID=2615049 RepID=UPI00273EBD4C|nr:MULTISPECIES: hypothetical protein [unclassified Allomuricauda]
MQKYLIVPTLFFLFLSCSSNEEGTGETPPEQDTKNPEITINGIDEDDTVEIITSVNVSISDEDNKITTTILLDNQEIANSEDKQITLDLDPFDFSNGTKTLIIESTDSSGNMSTVTRSFELKKLLFINSDFQIPPIFNNPELETYISINTMDGQLLDYKRIDLDEETRFYAPDMVERQNIIATLYLLYPNSLNRTGGLISFGNLLPGTKTITQNEVALRRLEYPITSSFQLTMTDALETTNFKMRGREYRLETVGATSTGNFSATLGYDPNLNGSMFMYSNPKDADDIQDYRFLFLNDFIDSTISFLDFKSPTNSATLEFPPEITDYSLTFHGYRNQEDYDLGKFSEILWKTNPTSPTVEVPLVEEFEIYEQFYDAKISENQRFITNVKGLGEIEIPDWSAQVEGSTVLTSGNYDQLLISTTFRGVLLENTVNRITWTYSEKNNAQVIMPFENLEVPQEIKTILDDFGIDPNNPEQIELLSLVLEGFEKDYRFEDGIFVGLGNSNYYGDEQSISYVIKDGTIN